MQELCRRSPRCLQGLLGKRSCLKEEEFLVWRDLRELRQLPRHPRGLMQPVWGARQDDPGVRHLPRHWVGSELPDVSWTRKDPLLELRRIGSGGFRSVAGAD